MEERTEWRGQSENHIGEEKRSGRLVGAAKTLLVLPRPAKTLQNRAGFSGKT